jgi:serine protease
MLGGEKAPRVLAMRANSARVVVRLRDGLDVPYTDDAASDLDLAARGAWRQLSARFPGVRMRRIFTTVPPERIRELEQRARTAADLLRWYFIDAPDVPQAHALQRYAATRQDLFVLAYVDPPGAETSRDAASGACSGAQGYLRPAPLGIDADFAGRLPGGRGEGQHFVDVEAGWMLAHERLRAHGTRRPLAGDNLAALRSHGTAVLGIVCGQQVNGAGCVGIAPHVASMNVSSVWHDHPSGRPRDQQFRQTALLSAIEALAARGGTPCTGVLLVEQVALYDVTVPVSSTRTTELRWDLPVEAAPLEFELVRLATALGITVVEAAGNGYSPALGAERRGVDLDRFLDPARADSGAILVAAAYASERTKIPASNYGARIDCYAWGDGVVTATARGPEDTSGCTNAFGGTSAAAAIIAGAALVVLGVAAAQPRARSLTGREVRARLAHGTRAARPGERIGVMPDLRTILSAL